MAATVLGVLFNFKSMGRLVFGSKDNSLLFRFIAVYVIVYISNVSGIGLLGLLGVNAYIAGALMITPAATISFLLNSKFVFKK